MTVGSLLLENAIRFGERRLYYLPDGRGVTYRNAVVQIAILAKRMEAAGLERGTPLICYNEMPLTVLDYFFAAQFLGVLFVPLSPIFTVGYALKTANKALAKHVLCEPAYLEEFESAGLTPLELAAPRFDRPDATHEEFSEALSYLRHVSAGIGSDDTVMLQATSGSTGEPKLVVRRHAALLHYARHLTPHFTEARDARLEPHRYLLLLSMAHSFGYHQTTTALMLGAELALPTGLDTSAEPCEMQALAPTIVPLPPRVLKALVDRERLAGGTGPLLPSGAQFVVIGGGRANPETLARLHSEGVTPIEIFSTSETSMIAITPRGAWRPGIGLRPLANVEVRLDADGEILVRSGALMRGYFEDPVATKNAMRDDGFYRTGDIGALEPTGELRYLSRKSDVFNTPEGSNIFPQRIEQLIETLPGVKQVLLIGDGLPFLTALVVIEPWGSWRADLRGILSCLNNQTLYEKFGRELEKINRSFERVEKVIRFQLRVELFPPECYSTVSGGKVRRDRVQVAKILAGDIAALYNRDSVLDASYVPGVERRLRGTQPPEKSARSAKRKAS